jgi:phosphatidylglycerol:prolipoprotein diacylglycerol transferase
MFPILQIGPLALQLPGLFLIAGVWVATLLIERAAPRNKLSPTIVNNMIFFALIAGILGARLGYVIQFINVYVADPLSVLALNPNTLSFPEGLLTAVLTAWIYAHRKGLPFWTTLDTLTPGAAAFMVALGLAHLASGDAFGAPVELPWAIDLWGAARHPSQVYEIIGAMLILIVVLSMQTQSLKPGIQAISFVTLTAAMRLFLEAFRGDSVLLFAGIRQAQAISLIVLLGGLIALRLLIRVSAHSS